MDTYLDKVRILFFKKYGNPDTSGLTRYVWIRNYSVIKFPANENGMYDNTTENMIYQLYVRDELNNGRHYAKCRLIYFHDVPVIIMEKLNLNPILVKAALPLKIDGFEWTYGIDSGQVGLNAAGKLVAYDYGS
jgi:hypothetical protein